MKYHRLSLIRARGLLRVIELSKREIDYAKQVAEVVIGEFASELGDAISPRERSTVSQLLASIEPLPSEDSMNEIESAVNSAERRLKTRRFKKVPDQPLGAVLEKRRVAQQPFIPGSVDDWGRPAIPPPPSPRPKLRSRIMYIEYQAFRSLKGSGFKANYYDVATPEQYWISGPRKDGRDRLYDGGPPVLIDDDVWEEYWSDIRKKSPPAKRGRR